MRAGFCLCGLVIVAKETDTTTCKVEEWRFYSRRSAQCISAQLNAGIELVTMDPRHSIPSTDIIQRRSQLSMLGRFRRPRRLEVVISVVFRLTVRRRISDAERAFHLSAEILQRPEGSANLDHWH
ncbi:hypothetical protein BV22DRAFT_1034733 [Leucogyrophana mollusca]|uniref:Uncharacterized protein n=1 Tax=Leucogyrophana mollusca TaxID=85980 RepID=A0ACB8BGB6_9AGAM|nr:hypothetical protein BV22DRAFT_1034733 [Leucogyrophana mollusca]